MTKHLNNLKNNKIKKTVATQHLGGDAVERMKKFLSELEKEARYAVRPLGYLRWC
jgi:nucleolar MIF4G domain-containing protein 1